MTTETETTEETEEGAIQPKGKSRKKPAPAPAPVQGLTVAVLQENLKRALAAVAHAVASRSTLPVLSNVLLAVRGGRLLLAATNLDMAIRVAVGGRVEVEGATTIPAKLLTDLVKELPNDKITLTLDERTQTTTLACARTTAQLKGIEADEFPTLEMLDAPSQEVARLDPAVLREVIRQVAVSAAKDDSRPVLQGVFCRFVGQQAIFATTDGFRLAVRRLQLEQEIEFEDLIIPGRTLLELARVIADAEEPVSISVTESRGMVIFRTGGIEVTSRVIEGRFPDYERIIPPEHKTRTVLDAAELKRAVKRAALFAQGSGNVLKLTFEPGGELRPGRLTLSANAAEVGENVEELDALIEGEEGQIALNADYLAEAIEVCMADQVAIETSSRAAPGIFKPVGRADFQTLVMPMSVR